MSLRTVYSRRVLLAAVVVALVLIAAGLGKIADPARFAAEIENYRLIPPVVAAALALYLPWLEISLGVGLVVPALRRTAAWLTLTLLGVFCSALLATLIRGLDIRCGCFGGAGGSGAGVALARNAVLLALLVYVVRASPRRD